MGALKGPDARRAAALVASLVLCTVMYFGSMRLARVVKINLTDSMPLGVYLVHPAPIAVGRIVVACPPEAAARLALENGYLVRGSCSSGAAPVLKYVVATGRSRVAVTPALITVNGRVLAHSSTHRNDHRGRPIPRVADGTYRLAPDEVWLYSPAPWSWDSRYFGPVERNQIVGVAAPLIVVPAR